MKTAQAMGSDGRIESHKGTWQGPREEEALLICGLFAFGAHPSGSGLSSHWVFGPVKEGLSTSPVAATQKRKVKIFLIRTRGQKADNALRSNRLVSAFFFFSFKYASDRLKDAPPPREHCSVLSVFISTKNSLKLKHLRCIMCHKASLNILFSWI